MHPLKASLEKEAFTTLLNKTFDNFVQFLKQLSLMINSSQSSSTEIKFLNSKNPKFFTSNFLVLMETILRFSHLLKLYGLMIFNVGKLEIMD